MTRHINKDLAAQVKEIEKVAHPEHMKLWRHDAFRDYNSQENDMRYRDFTNGYIIERHAELVAQLNLHRNPVPPSCQGNMQLENLIDGRGNYD